MNQTISIVTPSYNQSKYIAETIESVLSQRGDFFIDYIIMDGGSTDNSVEVIKKYESLLKTTSTAKEIEGLTYYTAKDHRQSLNRCRGISYRWVSEKDKGQVDAINKGMAIAKGEIIAFLNSDDLYYPDVLAKVVSANWNKIDFLYGKGMWVAENGKDLCLYPTFHPTHYSLFYRCTLCQPTVFINKKAFINLGPFDITYNYAFDYEYWVRAVIREKRFKGLPALLAKSRMYAENKSLSNPAKIGEEMSKILQTLQYNKTLYSILLKLNEKLVHDQSVKRELLLYKLLKKTG